MMLSIQDSMGYPSDTVSSSSFVLFALTAKQFGKPAYLNDLLHEYEPARTLQSSSVHLLHRPFTSTSLDSRSFSIAAPTVWNKLSVNTKSATKLGSLKSRVKTKLYSQSLLPAPPRTVQRHHNASVIYIYAVSNVFQIRLDQNGFACETVDCVVSDA